MSENTIIKLIDRLDAGERLDKSDFKYLADTIDSDVSDYLFEKARKKREKYYGNKVFVRGLIEFSSFCRNDCFYCGLRCSNRKAERYRLTKDEILECCREGYKLGFMTFVLQSGEDMYFTDEMICDIVRSIKSEFPECAVTLSIGEKTKESYISYFKAGADRFLLRHETADKEHYSRLHPEKMSLENRLKCLSELKDIGFQVGAGFMVGSPFQTTEQISEDLFFLQSFRPHMAGIGPFIPHKDTPFGTYPHGSVHKTLHLIALVRLILPEALIPATTALSTLDPHGKTKGILAGANVVMPNLSPDSVRSKYSLYNKKSHTGTESAQQLEALRKELLLIGCTPVKSRGDHYSCESTAKPANVKI